MHRGAIWSVSLAALGGLLISLTPAEPAQDKTGAERQEIRAVLDKALGYLKTSQAKDGSFSAKLAGPGITGVVVAGLIQGGVSADEPVVARALKHTSKPRSRTTAASTARASLTTPPASPSWPSTKRTRAANTTPSSATPAPSSRESRRKTTPRTLHSAASATRPRIAPTCPTPTSPSRHCWRPACPRMTRRSRILLKFIGRCQNLPGEFNDQAWAKKAGKDDLGGMTYLPFDTDDNRHKTPDGGLRSLGGMTYGGLKSFLYAGVDKNDPRVKAAVNWIRNHYTVEENPGMGQKGLYYYYHTFAKAMHAWGEDPFADAKGTKHPWRRELFMALKAKQQDNGSWINAGDKTFMELNPDIATGFAVLSAELHATLAAASESARIAPACGLAARPPEPLTRKRGNLVFPENHIARAWVGTALAAMLAIPALARADAFDNYTNTILAKVPTSKLAEPIKQLTPELMVQHSRALPGGSAAFVVIKTNDNRFAKLLIQPAGAQDLGNEYSVPILLVERFVTYREGEERTIVAKGQDVRLFAGFHFSLDIGQVVPAKLGGDVRYVVEGDKSWLEPVGKAEMFLVTKHLPEATLKKGAKVVVGEKFDPAYFAGTYKLYSDGRRSGTLQLKLSENGKEVDGWYYSDKDGAKYEVSGAIGNPKHLVEFAIQFPRTIETFRGMLFTGDGRAIAGTARLQDRETGFYAVRVEE